MVAKKESEFKMKFCKNCGAELTQTFLGVYLHTLEINIGSVEKPFIYKGGTTLSRTTTCCNPEVK